MRCVLNRAFYRPSVSDQPWTCLNPLLPALENPAVGPTVCRQKASTGTGL